MTDLAELKKSLEAQGLVVVTAATYRRTQERARVADALRAAQEEHNAHTRAWASEAFAEQRRLADRLTHVYGVARAHGASTEELRGPE